MPYRHNTYQDDLEWAHQDEGKTKRRWPKNVLMVLVGLGTAGFFLF